jgi:hypothetical protein
MPYYHYTSRTAAQSIISTGIIRPGSSGFVYLATEVYATGAAAADALSIRMLSRSPSKFPTIPVLMDFPENTRPHRLWVRQARRCVMAEALK